MKYQPAFPAMVVALTLIMATPFVHAGWSDMLGDLLGQDNSEQPGKAAKDTSRVIGQQDMDAAILEALSVGVKRAIKLLGEPGGYLDDAKVRIPMPAHLQKVESLMRRFGQNKYADRFISSMNRAAEQAVPQTTQIFLDTIKNMSVKDASALLNGADDAATRYLEEKTSAQLSAVIAPIVSRTMNDVGVTSAYKKFVSKADFVGGYIDQDSLDIDAFVTEKTLDGLFIKLADEEAKIRKDPVARSTDLLQKVFSQFGS